MDNTADLAGTLHPKYDENMPRFMIYVRGYEPDDEPNWQYKLVFIDRMYQDSDGYPVEAIAGGSSWEKAFARAASMVEQALDTDHCIFI